MQESALCKSLFHFRNGVELGPTGSARAVAGLTRVARASRPDPTRVARVVRPDSVRSDPVRVRLDSLTYDSDPAE
jgi:hypothetical protein